MSAIPSRIDVTHFEREGFQVFRNALPIEIVDRVREFLSDEIYSTLAPAKTEIGCTSDAEIVNLIGEIAKGRRGNVESLSKATRDALSGHFSLQARLSERLWDIPLSRQFFAIVQSLLNSQRIFLHMPPTARYVLPGNIYAGVPPHQDISYNKHMSDFVTVWVPMVDIDDDCGGVTVWVGSGHEPEHPVLQSPTEFWQKGVRTDGFAPVHCKIKAGDVLALNRFVIHQSMPNKSNRTRISVDFRFFGERDRSSKHYLDLQQCKVIPPSIG